MVLIACLLNWKEGRVGGEIMLVVISECSCLNLVEAK